MRVLWERFDWVLPIFLKSLKSGSVAGIIEKYRECNAYVQLWDANSTALPQSYLASIRSGGATLLEMWIIWDGMLNYGLAGRSQNVLFNLYLIDSKIKYKKLIFFIVTPCQIWDQIWKRLHIIYILLSPIIMFGFQKNSRNHRVIIAVKAEWSVLSTK